MKPSSVRRRCKAALQDVEVPDPFDLSVFCDSLAARRGRPLHLHSFNVSATGKLPCGVYLSLGDGDHIFYDARTSRLHRDHIVLHEISHMLLNHATDSGLYDMAARLMPSIDQRTLALVLARTSYTTEHEQEAEFLATLIAGAARSRTKAAGEGVPSSPILDRLHTTLGHVTASGHRR
ncbi:MAG: hypothetical protein ACRDV3_03100 [Acidothermaceae bacterium]